MTDEQNTTPENEPVNESINEPANDSQNDPLQTINLDTEMKPNDEPTKPAASQKSAKPQKESKNDGTKKDTPAKPENKPKKDYSFLIMAVVALSLGLLFIYLRNRNKQRAAANADGLEEINDAETVHDIPHEEQGPPPTINGNRDVSHLFNTRSPFENPDYDGRN